MTGFFTDGDVPEAPESYAAQQAFEKTPETYGNAIEAEAGQSSPTFSILRAAQREQTAPTTTLPTFLSTAFGLGPMRLDDPTVPKPAPKPAEYINNTYGPIGPDGKKVNITSAPMTEPTAQLIAKAKANEMDREGVLSRFQNTHSGLATFAVGAAGFLMDPLNDASLMVPGLGEDTAALAAAKIGLTKGLGAKIGTRAIQGATGATFSQVPLTATRYGLGREEASDYDLRSAFTDMAFAAAGGAVLHAGFGAIGDAWKSRGFLKPDNLKVPEDTMPENASVILNADATTKHSAMSSAVSQIMDGREVDVYPMFPEKEGAKTLENVAQEQKTVYQEGYSPGMTTGELKDGEADLFPQEDKEPETEAQKYAKENYEPEEEEPAAHTEDVAQEIKEDNHVQENLSPDHKFLQDKFGAPENMSLSALGKLDKVIGKIFGTISEAGEKTDEGPLVQKAQEGSDWTKGSNVSDEQFQALEDYGRRVEDAKEKAAQTQKPSFGKTGKGPSNPLDQQIADLEAKIKPEDLTAEEQAHLDATKKSMDAADLAKSALKQAVTCLTGGITGE